MAEDKDKGEEGAPTRQFIGVNWECCKIYSRIYLNRKGTAFVGWCPKCARRVQINVSPVGSKSRFFNVG
jgi:hypothetical protein